MHCSVLTGECTSTYSGEWGECPGGTSPIFGYGWAAEGLKRWPCLGQKNPKIHALFGPTLEDTGQNASRFCFKAILILATVVEQIHVKVIALYAWTTNKIHLSNQINPCRQYPVDRFTRQTHRLTPDYTPCLGQRRQKPYPAQKHILV